VNEYFKALKIVAAPLATIMGIAGVIVWFAADAWIRGIVDEEIAAIQSGQSGASSMLQSHAQTLEEHAEDIEDNTDEIDEVDDKFTEFVREILARL
jgi:xanthosine utilization system XapX-like protein